MSRSVFPRKSPWGVNGYLDEDRRLFQKWLSEPIKPYVVIRLIAAVYSHVDVPEVISSQQEAEEYAAGLAQKYRLRVCLVWSRRLSIYFSKDGSLDGIMEAAQAPAMRIGGKDCLLKIDEGKIGVVPVRDKEQGYYPRE